MSALPILRIAFGLTIGLLGYLYVRSRYSGVLPQDANRNAPKEDSSPRYAAEPGEMCCICLNPMDITNIRYLRCFHAMHVACYQQCRQHTNRCPTCRAPF